jgi:hypothetical protein
MLVRENQSHKAEEDPSTFVSKMVSFATARQLSKIGSSDVADVSCKLIVTV